MTISNSTQPGLAWWKRLIERFRQQEKGQSLVEFAMVLPIMLVLMFALVDFGRAFHTWLVVTNAAREGARAGAVQHDAGQIQSRIHDSMGSLDSSRLTITLNNVQGPRGEAVEVDLSYDFEFVTPLGPMVSAMSGGNVSAPDIGGSSSMRLE